MAQLKAGDRVRLESGNSDRYTDPLWYREEEDPVTFATISRVIGEGIAVELTNSTRWMVLAKGSSYDDQMMRFSDQGYLWVTKLD